MKINESVVRDVLDLHSEFRIHPVARWAMTKVGVHPALVARKGPHPRLRRVGTDSAFLCTGGAHPSLVISSTERELNEESIDVQYKS